MTHEAATLAFQPRSVGIAHSKPRSRAVRALRLLVALLMGLLGLSLKPSPGALAAGLGGTGTPDTSGRLRVVQVLQDGKDGVAGLFGAASVAVGPDGANIYVTGFYGDTLAVFARDAQSGQLTFLEVQRNGVNGVDGLSNAVEVAVSPDGAHVYVTSYQGSALVAFARDPLTGRLTFVQAQREGLPGPNHRLVGLAVSPDGKHVYVSGEGTENDVAVFARDAVTGMLTPIEAVSTGLPPTYGVQVSADGAQVYAAGPAAKALTAFQRDPTTGQLTRLASWRNGVDNVQGLDGAQIVALSADGASFYVAGYGDHAVAVFARDVRTGLLSFVQAVQSGVGGVLGLKGARGLAVSPDGAHVWAGGFADKAIVLFSRNSNTGQLDFVEVRRDVVAGWIGMGQMNRLALSPDGRYLYGASSSYNALLVFSTDEGGMAPIVRCAGDCGWDSQVTIDELLQGVNIALGNLPLSACEMFDSDGDGAVTVDELLRGVNNALNGCVDPLSPGDHRRTLAFGGYSRIYDVHIPLGYDGRTAVPLLVDFHGFSGNPTGQAGLSGWRALADSEGFIIAYPLGLFGQAETPEDGTPNGPSFNAGGCCGGAALRRADDVGFARAIVQAVTAEANVDRARVYATGWSNGGGMSHRLACQAADVFAAIASVAGRIGLKPMSLCQPSRPIAVVEFDGLNDPDVPYGGNLFWPPAQTNFAYWRDKDSCGSGPPDDRVDYGASYCETYQNCSAGVQVERCSIEASQLSFGAGHCLYLNPDLDVTRTAWEFLQRFQLSGQ